MALLFADVLNSDVLNLLAGDKRESVSKLNKPRGGEVYLFRTNGGIRSSFKF